MKEHRVLVWKDGDEKMWYTLQIRSTFLFFRLWWKTVKPLNHPSYEKAVELILPKKCSHGEFYTNYCGACEKWRRDPVPDFKVAKTG